MTWAHEAGVDSLLVGPLHLTLYIAGASTVRSITAKRRLALLVEELSVETRINVIDVLESPEMAEEAGVVATPTLVRELPAPGHRVIGDLADPRTIARALRIERFLRRQL